MRFRVLLIFAISVALCSSAFGQRYGIRDWRALRRMIEAGQDPSSLLKRQAAVASANHRESAWGLSRRQDLVRKLACKGGIRPDLVLAIVAEESNFNQRAVGPYDEIGAGQILPATAATYGFDPERLRDNFAYNINASIIILRSLLAQFPLAQAVAAYNGGPGFQDSPPRVQQEVRHYVRAVLRKMEGYENVQCG